MAIIGLVLPMLFYNPGLPGTLSNFSTTLYFLLSLAAGDALLKIKNLKLKIAVVLLTLPTSLITLHDVYLPARPPAMISPLELEALNFLRHQPAGIVLPPLLIPILMLLLPGRCISTNRLPMSLLSPASRYTWKT